MGDDEKAFKIRMYDMEEPASLCQLSIQQIPKRALLFPCESPCSFQCWCFGIKAEYCRNQEIQPTSASITTQYVYPDAVHMGSQHIIDALNSYFYV